MLHRSYLLTLYSLSLGGPRVWERVGKLGYAGTARAHQVTRWPRVREVDAKKVYLGNLGARLLP